MRPNINGKVVGGQPATRCVTWHWSNRSASVGMMHATQWYWRGGQCSYEVCDVPLFEGVQRGAGEGTQGVRVVSLRVCFQRS